MSASICTAACDFIRCKGARSGGANAVFTACAVVGNGGGSSSKEYGAVILMVLLIALLMQESYTSCFAEVLQIQATDSPWVMREGAVLWLEKMRLYSTTAKCLSQAATQLPPPPNMGYVIGSCCQVLPGP